MEAGKVLRNAGALPQHHTAFVTQETSTWTNEYVRFFQLVQRVMNSGDRNVGW